MEKLIFIDLDGTLTPQSTWFLLNTKLGITPEEDKNLFLSYIDNNLDYESWISEIVRLYKSRGTISKKELQDFAETIELRNDAFDTVEQLKGKGYRVVVLSGSVDCFVEILSKKVGAHDWRSSSRLVFDSDGALTNIIASGDEAPSKDLLAKQYAAENGYTLPNAYSVDDGGNGIELFKHTKGIILGSNEKLLPFAWKQVNALSEIITLIQ